MVRGHQQRRVDGQRLDDPGQQRVDTCRRFVPLGRADTEHMSRGVQVGGIAVDQSGRRTQLVDHALGVVLVVVRRDELRAAIRRVGESAAHERRRQHGARTDAGPLQPPEPGWQRLPLRCVAGRRATECG